MTIISVNPNPVPVGQSVTISFSPGTAANVAVTLNGTPVPVMWAAGVGSITIKKFPGVGDYLVRITNDLNDSASTPVTAQ